MKMLLFALDSRVNPQLFLDFKPFKDDEKTGRGEIS